MQKTPCYITENLNDLAKNPDGEINERRSGSKKVQRELDKGETTNKKCMITKLSKEFVNGVIYNVSLYKIDENVFNSKQRIKILHQSDEPFFRESE